MVKHVKAWIEKKIGQKDVDSKNNTSNPHVQYDKAHIVTNVIGDPTMFDEWSYDMQAMASQIKTICQRLYDEFFTKDKNGKTNHLSLSKLAFFVH